MRTIYTWLGAAAIIVLTACHTGGSSTPTPAVSPTPAVAQTIGGITSSAALHSAIAGPDARIWFTEFNVSQLAAVTTSGVVTEYPMPAASQPNGITVGSDNNIWTGGFGGVLLKVTTSGVWTSYPLAAGSHIGGLALGPDGNVWFADYGNRTVGNITTAGVITSYAAPAGTSPVCITRGADGNLWVADSAGSILRVTPTGVFTQFTSGLSTGASPQGIIAAPDGNLYFTEPFFNAIKNDRVGKVTPATGAIAELGSLAPNSYPNKIAIGKDGNLYFTETGTGALGKVAISSGTVTETPLGLPGISAIAEGPDYNLWLGGMQTIYKVTY